MFKILVLLLLIILVCSIKVVNTGYVYIVERFGKYNRTLDAGWHIVYPIVDHVRAKVSKKQQIVEIEPQSVITKDNVKVTIDDIIFYKVVEPIKAVYNIENYEQGVVYSSAINMRDCVGKIDLDEVLSNRAELNNDILKSVENITKEYGVEIISCEIKNINPPSEVVEAMEKLLKSDREKKAVILEAGGAKQSAITRAEGEKQARILEAEAQKEANIRKAEGLKQSQLLEAEGKAKAIETVANAQAKAIKVVNTAILDSGTNETVIALKQIEALQEMAKNPANKLIIPSETVSALGSIATIAKVIKGSENDKETTKVIENSKEDKE